MHAVSQDWVDNEEKQLSGKTDLRFQLFSIATPPVRCVKNGNAVCNCLELFAVSNCSNANDYITFYFAERYNRIVFNSNTYRDNKANCTIEFWGTSLTPPFTPQLLLTINAGQDMPTSSYLDNVQYVVVKGNTKYMLLDGIKTELTNSDIVEATYKAHCSAINIDLPYHKVVFSTIEKSFPIYNALLGYFEVGYNDEYITLGCGYYYADKGGYKNDGFIQSYKFVDIISMLSQKYIFKNSSIYTMHDLLEMMLTPSTTYLTSIPELKYVPNYVDGNYFDQNELLGYSNTPYNKTVAEVLQMVAQTKGAILYVDENNIIRFKSQQLIDFPTIHDTNDMWLLEKPVENVEESVKNLTVNFKRMAITDTPTPPELIGTYTGKTDYRIDLSQYGIVSLENVSGGTALISISSLNMVYITASGSSVQFDLVYINKHSQQVIETYDLAVSGSGKNMILDIELCGTPSSNTLIQDVVDFLKLTTKQSMVVRFDSKYYVLDKLTSDYREYSDFIIEDIQTTYGQGSKGTIKGSVVKKRLRAPIVKDFNGLGIVIINPNPVSVRLTNYFDTSVFQNTYNFEPLQERTILYSSDTDLYLAYGLWQNDNDVSAYGYFDDGTGAETDYLDSKDTRLFGGN